jgi:nicotinamidase-related amidase
MSNPGSLLSAADSVLVLIDIQEKFRPTIAGIDDMIKRTAILARAAVRLGVPILATEQYPKALGPTVPELKCCLPDSQAYLPKMCFSSAACVPFREALAAAGRKQVVLAGIETHVCVLQTALELVASGHSVYVVEDAVSSRKLSDRQAALERMSRRGVERITSEMALFEWLRQAGTPEFKEIQALIK